MPSPTQRRRLRALNSCCGFGFDAGHAGEIAVNAGHAFDFAPAGDRPRYLSAPLVRSRTHDREPLNRPQPFRTIHLHQHRNHVQRFSSSDLSTALAHHG